MVWVVLIFVTWLAWKEWKTIKDDMRTIQRDITNMYTRRIRLESNVNQLEKLSRTKEQNFEKVLLEIAKKIDELEKEIKK